MTDTEKYKDFYSDIHRWYYHDKNYPRRFPMRWFKSYVETIITDTKKACKREMHSTLDSTFFYDMPDEDQADYADLFGEDGQLDKSIDKAEVTE